MIMKCSRCGKVGFLRKIDKETGLCDKCVKEIQSLSQSKGAHSQISKPERLLYDRNAHERSSVRDISTSMRNSSIETLFDTFDDFVRQQDTSCGKDEESRRLSRKTVAPGQLFVQTPSINDASSNSIDIKPDKKSRINIDDLRIRPADYELPDDDDIPFDLPETKEMKSFPKLKRIEALSDEPPMLYHYPPIDLLAQGESEEISTHGQRDMQKARLLEDTLQSFGISAKLTGIAHGPAVTRFELQPAPGVKLSRIVSLADDIALNLAAMSIRVAPVPGKAAVGVEIPNDKIETVRLREVLESPDARKHPSRLAVGLGKDNSGRYIVADIAKMPHILIAGQTDSGKTVCLNSIIASILFRASPEEVKLLLIDPKVIEFSVYNDIPHLICPVVTDPKKAASALDWVVAEMVKRNKIFAEQRVRDIASYNSSLTGHERRMPQLVIIIDEIVDLMALSPGEVEDSVCRIAQQGRACGIHLVIATQNPSANVITGNIKNNIPTRIAFSVASQIDSRKIIDCGGAEDLTGNGDMLFVPNGMMSMRMQCSYISDDEVRAVVTYIKMSHETNYSPDVIEHIEYADRSGIEMELFEAEYDPKLPEAVDIALDLGQASISMLQRKMRIGYARAGRILDEMSRRGILSEPNGSAPREVLISREQAIEMFEDLL